MSRFTDEWDGDEFPNQSALWWANIERSLKGKRGQAALADLEAALLELPQPRLVNGYLAVDGDVCAIGALAVHRRRSKGEEMESILADLEGRIPACCECGHPKSAHDEHGVCHHKGYNDRGCWSNCTAFKLGENCDEPGDDVTATVGVSIGLTYGLAWKLAYVNDEHGQHDETPEERYQRVLAWVREHRVTSEAAAA